jgi:hypothetical protein
MQSKTTRIAHLLVTLAFLTDGAGAVTGCGSERAVGSGGQAPGTGQETAGGEPRPTGRRRLGRFRGR